MRRCGAARPRPLAEHLLRVAAARHAGCSGRRNCNVNLDELRGDRPELDCEPLQAGGIPRNLQLDETLAVMMVIADIVGRGGRDGEEVGSGWCGDGLVT